MEFTEAESNLRKSPLADDVDLPQLANRTDGFSGADITEVCQRSCKLAIRYEIDNQLAAEQEAEKKGLPPPVQSLDGKLDMKIFNEAMSTARKSVSKSELELLVLVNLSFAFSLHAHL